MASPQIPTSASAAWKQDCLDVRVTRQLVSKLDSTNPDILGKTKTGNKLYLTPPSGLECCTPLYKERVDGAFAVDRLRRNILLVQQTQSELKNYDIAQLQQLSTNTACKKAIELIRAQYPNGQTYSLEFVEPDEIFLGLIELTREIERLNILDQAALSRLKSHISSIAMLRDNQIPLSSHNLDDLTQHLTETKPEHKELVHELLSSAKLYTSFCLQLDQPVSQEFSDSLHSCLMPLGRAYVELNAGRGLLTSALKEANKKKPFQSSSKPKILAFSKPKPKVSFANTPLIKVELKKERLGTSVKTEQCVLLLSGESKATLNGYLKLLSEHEKPALIVTIGQLHSVAPPHTTVTLPIDDLPTIQNESCGVQMIFVNYSPGDKEKVLQALPPRFRPTDPELVRKGAVGYG
ncbi:hypothetical protein JQC92_15565 [Shewanella sp. 202IG2-18]|uniref:hypothetical protein n=1 Tax=Parashewanella hymeniacidonis TaxID=2807618 RepID=UPI0019602BBB|nr:hypothetical protein [Parashewanella hymeniacidonis]MBM7073431.1 hypothetical protein [Parashewanella hymeniacidonis]